MSERTDTGFRTGGLEVIHAFEGCVLIKVGDAEVAVQATPKGRRAYVRVEQRDKTDVQMSAYIDGKWTRAGR